MEDNGGLVALLIVIWLVFALAGLAGFVTSLVCFGRSGTPGQHVAGFLVAFFFGPFYWLYYAMSSSYCA